MALMRDPIPYHYLVETNTTGYCTDAAITSWMGSWPTQCALETAQSALHTLFVLCVFQFALGMLRQRATAPHSTLGSCGRSGSRPSWIIRESSRFTVSNPRRPPPPPSP